MAGTKQNAAATWKKMMKNVDIDEPISFLDHVYLGSTQHECNLLGQPKNCQDGKSVAPKQ